MKSLKSLLFVFSLVFWACSEEPQDTTGVWVDDPAMAYGESSSSMLVSSSDVDGVSSSSKMNGSSSSAALTSSSEGDQSSSSTNDFPFIGDFGNSSIELPEGGCVSPSFGDGGAGAGALYKPRIHQDTSYGVIAAITRERVKVLVEGGLSLDSAIAQSRSELFRELGLDSLLERIDMHESSLELTLHYLYKNPDNEKEIRQDVIDDFSDGKFNDETYCIDDWSYDMLGRLYSSFMPIGCAIAGYEMVEPTAILQNIWRKCAGMPYCDESVGDTMITIGDNHFVCEESSWQTLVSLGREMNGIICTKNNARTIGVGQTNNDLTYVCYEGTWRSILNTADLPAEYFFNPEFNYGTFVDSRDGHVYKTTVYKGQTWLAQDMDYYDATDSLFVKQSKCAKIVDYESHTESENRYCDGTSRFYTVNVSKKVCPEGWRLPNKSDWQHVVDMNYTAGMENMQKNLVIGSFVRGKTRKATDEYGLSLRMDGGVDPYGRDMTMEGYNLFWVEEGEIVTNSDYGAHFSKVDYRENGQYVPVRCIKK